MKIKFIKDFMATQSDDFRDLHAILIKRGDIVDVDGCKYNDSYFDMPKEQAQWLIDNGFAEEVQESGWWKPKANEEYYFLAASGEVYIDSWVNGGLDELRYSMGECFKTKEATKRWREYLKANATVRQDEGVMTPKEVESAERSNGDVWCISYTLDRGLFAYTCRLDVVPTRVGTIYFDTSEHAEASLDKHPDEWKIIANYDWSRE